MRSSHQVLTAQRGGLIASLTALGVVFGDIGTSPLYVMKAVFAVSNLDLNRTNILGITSCIIWFLMLLVTGKYVLLVLRADNKGEGGIIALASLVRSLVRFKSRPWLLSGLAGAFGAALFFGDSVITPAISVLSAMEGLTVGAPHLGGIVVPCALVLLTLLFLMQRFGTSTVGKAFGPIMLLWFLSFAALGLPHILEDPSVTVALSPHIAVLFMLHHPLAMFIALGAIVLALTGAEALYADIAHFGRKPIQAAWFAVALPALIIIYLGQAALLIDSEQALSNPFFLLAPSWAHIPLLIGATLATLIASQAVISGAYSIALQCSRLNLLPHVRVLHTSETEAGQVYLPGVNTLLYAAVAAIVLIFRNSETLSGAYGMAVSTDFLLTTSLLLAVTHLLWKWPKSRTYALAALLLIIEIPLWAANIIKITTGGWLPLAIAAVLFTIMLIWLTGVKDVTDKRLDLEVPLLDYLDNLVKKPPRRISGTGIYFHSIPSTVPLMLKRHVEMNKTLHDRVLIVSMKTMQVPHTDAQTRAEIVQVNKDLPGVYHVLMRYGFKDLREPLADLKAASISQLRTWDFERAWVFTSHVIVTTGAGTAKDSTSRDVKRASRNGEGDGPSTLESKAHASKRSGLFRTAIHKIFILLSRFSASPGWLRHIPLEQQIEGAFHVAI